MGTTSINVDEDNKLKYAKNPNKKKDNNKGDENDEKEEEEQEQDKEEDKEEEKDDKEDETKKIRIKIKSDIGIWEKDYNINKSLKEIELDFKLENNIDKDKKYEFTLNNCELEMDSRTLNSIIIDEDQNEIIIEQKNPKIEKNINIDNIDNISNPKNINYIAKPMANPFEIYIFEIREKIIKKIKYKKEKMKYLELDKYGADSSYCNGINHLFISGGTDPISNQILEMFVDLDIENNKLRKKLNMPIAKRNHSMIYFDEKVYIIGGNDVKTMFYDMKNQEIFEWKNLNQKKYKPSLIMHNSHIFCFDFSQKYSSEYCIEKISLVSTISEWEIIRPKFDSDIRNLISSEKYFGIVQDKDENIFFLGGVNDSENINDNIFMKYNVQENMIEKNKNLKLINIENNKDLIFEEKSLLKLDGDTCIIFPYFIQRNPKILCYHKNNNSLELIVYHSKPQLKEKYNNNKNIEALSGLKPNIPLIKNNFVIKNVDNKIETEKNRINKRSTKNEENENSKNKERIIKNNSISNNISMEKSRNEEENNDNNKENRDINKINKKDKEESRNKIIELNRSKSASSKHSENSNINKPESEKEKSSIKSRDKSIEINCDNLKKEIDEDSQTETQKEEQDKIEETIKDNNDIIISQEKENFHSCVNMNLNFAKLDNNKAVKNNLKKLNIAPAEDVDVKVLKKARRQFNNFKVNDSDDFDNY